MPKVRLVPKGTAKNPIRGKLVPKNDTPKPKGKSPFRKTNRNVA